MPRADVIERDEFDRPAGRRSPEELKRLVRYQRWVIGLVLAQLALGAVCAALGAAGGEKGIGRVLVTLFVAIYFVTGAFVFLLESTLHDVVAGLFGGLLTLVPGLGLLFLTMANQGASAELRKHGLTVGFFGARLADAGDGWSPYDVDEDTGW